MLDSYLSFCETLWRSWLDGTLRRSSFLERTFDLDAAPEPYLAFDAGTRPLVALTTNPGATMDFQRRRTVQKGVGPVSSSMDYATASRAFAHHYERVLT